MKSQRPARPIEPIGPTPELLAHAETLLLPPELAGLPPTRKRAPAHRRLAKARRIPQEVETEIERFVMAWEMVEGGAHEQGSGGDGQRTREEVMIAMVSRLNRARARVTREQEAMVVWSCVESHPAWQVAIRCRIYRIPETTPVADLPRWQRDAREALDKALVPVLYAISGIPMERQHAA